MEQLKSMTRQAGLFWFLAAVSGGYGLSYIRSNIIVSGDAAATAANVIALEPFYRTAIVSGLLSQLFLFLFGLTMYQLFKRFNHTLANVLLASILLTVGLTVANHLNHFGALLMVSQLDYLKAFTLDQRQAMMMIFFRLSNSGQGLLELFWTPYYFTLGVLVIKSKLMPKLLGILLVIMSIGFAVNVYTKFLLPHFYPVFFTQMAMALGALGGIPSTLWLLLKGGNVAELQKAAA